MAKPANKKEAPKALYGVFRDGKRVYLPPKDAPGVDLEQANRLCEHLPGSVTVCVYDPEDNIGQAAE